MHESIEKVVELVGVSNEEVYEVVQSVYLDSMLELNSYCESVEFTNKYAGHNDIVAATDMVNEMTDVGVGILEKRLLDVNKFSDMFGSQSKLAAGLMGISFGFMIKKHQIESLAEQYADDCWDQYLQIPFEDKELFIAAMSYDISMLINTEEFAKEFIPHLRDRFNLLGEQYKGQLQ